MLKTLLPKVNSLILSTSQSLLVHTTDWLVFLHSIRDSRLNRQTNFLFFLTGFQVVQYSYFC